MAKIGVDVGHGLGVFPPSKGVYRNGVGYAEYDANSRVAKQLTERLESDGHTVVLAQPFNSNDVPLSTRTNIYFAEDVDLIVSCHANYNSNPSANGYASFYWYNDTEAKKLSDLYVEEIKSQGFRLWGGSRPSRPNDWSNFHMCRVPASKGIPSILIENGFMGNKEDFEWIFGSKKNEYAEKCATAAYNAIQRYLGLPIKEERVQHVPKPKAKVLYRVRKSANDSQSQLGAYSVLDNAKLMATDNKGYKVFDTNGKLIFDPHKKSQSKPQPKSKKLAVGDKVVLSKSATKYATGQNIPSFVKGKKYTIMQLKSDRALLREIMSWVYLEDIGVNVSTPSKPKPKPTTKKEYVHLPASAKTWKTYRLNVQPISKNSDWSLTPSRFGGLTYEILGEPYPHVVTIMTGKGKRNIYVAPSTSARRYKK